MATEQLSFIRLKTGSFPASGLTKGAIYFCPEEHTIGVATSATTVEKYYGGRVKDAVYNKDAKSLTITYNDGTTSAVLDFSDMASADAVSKELDNLKALHAVASTDGSGKKTYKTVAAEINNALGGLDLTQVGAAGKYISAVSQVDGQVAATASDFDTVINDTTKDSKVAPTTKAVKDYVDSKATSTTSGLKYEDTAVDGQYVSEVDQTNGIISVKRKALPTLNTAIDKTGTTTDGNAPTSGAVKTYVTDKVSEAIRGLDFTDKVDGEYVTTINETDGVFTIEKGTFDTSIAADSTSTKAPTSKAVAELVKSEIEKLGNSLTFKGAYLDSNIQDGLSGTFNDGDVVIATDTAKEYVRYDGAWRELGNEGQVAALINDLNVTDSPENGQYVAAVSQTNGKIAVTRRALPTPTYNNTITADTTKDGNAPTTGAVKTYVEGKITSTLSDLKTTNAEGQQAPLAAGDGKFVSSVGQQNGKVSIGSTAFNTVINDTTATSVIAPTTKATKDYVDSKINDLDVAFVGGPAKIITTVAQENGKVQATASDVDTVISATTAVPSDTSAIHVPTTKAVKDYVDTEVSKAVNGALVWSSWE